jgi:DNA-binding NarL/FixJ family response regulator
MQQPNNTIAVLDDHFLIAEAIEKIVSANPSYVFYGGFNNSAQLQEYISQQGVPAFLLLDINLDGEDGIVLCRQFTKQYPGLKVIMLTGLTQAAIVKNAMKNGAHGFMPKNMQREALWECLATVKSGAAYLHKDIKTILLEESLDIKRPASEYIPKLSRREKEVLELIMKEMTTQEIAAALFISVNTVETHRSSLLSKLGAKNIAGLVKITLEKGLLHN